MRRFSDAIFVSLATFVQTDVLYSFERSSTRFLRCVVSRMFTEPQTSSAEGVVVAAGAAVVVAFFSIDNISYFIYSIG